MSETNGSGVHCDHLADGLGVDTSKPHGI